MIKRLKLFCKDKRGMTLVETIVGFTLLAIATTMLMTGFMTAGALVNEANKFKMSSAAVATAIDVEDPKITHTEATVSIKNYSNIKGEYVYYTDSETGIKYKAFVPSAIPEERN